MDEAWATADEKLIHGLREFQQSELSAPPLERDVLFYPFSGPDALNIHAFVATPVNQSMGQSVADVAPTRPKSNLPANVSNQHLQRFGLGRFEQ